MLVSFVDIFCYGCIMRVRKSYEKEGVLILLSFFQFYGFYEGDL